MHRFLKHSLVALTVPLMISCGTANVTLTYAPHGKVALASQLAPPVMLGTFIDQRGEPSNWLGTVRGGFGNPLYKLQSERPVAEIVRIAFLDAIRLRQIKTDSSSSLQQISGVIKKLDCNKNVFGGFEANAQIEITVVDSLGQQRFVRTYSISNVDNSTPTGTFSSVDDLHRTLERTLREVIDQALDDSALRSVLRL